MQLGSTVVAALEVGGYISIWKSVLLLFFLLVWARLLTWIDKDAPAAHLPREVLNAGVFGAGVGGFVLFFLLPSFWIGLAALFVCQAGGICTYLGFRQKVVGLGDLKTALGEFARNPLGKKKEETEPEAVAGQVMIIAKNNNAMPVPTAEDPQRVGYDTVQRILADPLQKGAERIDVQPSEGAAVMQVTIDGVTYSAPSIDRNAAAAGIAWLKLAAGLDMNEKRKPQKGTVRTVLDGKRRALEIRTAGSTAGEYLRLQSEAKERLGRRLDDLNMLPEQAQIVKESAADGTGVVLLTAPRSQGLNTLLYAVLRTHDAFLTHIQSLERGREMDLEGVTQTDFPANVTPADEHKQVEWVISQQPDTIMIDQVTNPQSARDLIAFAAEKRAYIGMRAGSTFEALKQWRALVGDDAQAIGQLRYVVAGRVLRRLCSACKMGYTPDPEILRKLNFDPARITKLYQARKTPPRDKKGNPILCTFCQELRFKGRFGIYELLNIDEEMRQALLSGASDKVIMGLFRKQRGLLLQEVALMHVEAGDTSVDEVVRAMRGGADSGAGQKRAPTTAG